MKTRDRNLLDVRERRLTEQLVLYWNSLRANDDFPSLADVNSQDIMDIWADCFVVKIKQFEEHLDHEYEYIGENIYAMFGGVLSSDVILNMSDALASKYEEVIRMRLPIVDESQFVNANRDVVQYRQIVLPLGSNDVVEHLLCGVRYDIVAAEKVGAERETTEGMTQI